MTATVCRNVLALFSALFSIMPAMADTEWHDASDFPVYGKASDSTLTRYERLPASFENTVRKPLWNLGRNSAGLAVRFSSDSPFVKVRWESMSGNSMDHMAETGVKGLDLYILDGNEWRFAGVGRPKGKCPETSLVAGMTWGRREYMLLLHIFGRHAGRCRRGDGRRHSFYRSGNDEICGPIYFRS